MLPLTIKSTGKQKTNKQTNKTGKIKPAQSFLLNAEFLRHLDLRSINPRLTDPFLCITVHRREWLQEKKKNLPRI